MFGPASEQAPFQPAACGNTGASDGCRPTAPVARGPRTSPPVPRSLPLRSTWRVACVRVPRFALGALWAHRHAPGTDAPVADPARWDHLALAVVREGRVVDATLAARRTGERGGPPGVAPHAALLLDWDAPVVDAAVTQATARLLAASPQVTPVAGAPGMWWAAVGGPDGPGPGERAVALALVRAARRWHPQARVAVAGSCVAARAAVWDAAPAAGAADGVRVVPRGGCAPFIAGAPIGFVPMDALLRQALLAAGVRTVGALAAHDPATVGARWGAAGLAAWRLARGEDARRPVLGGDAARRAVAAELATPTLAAAPVLALVRAALERLAAQLAAERRRAAAVALTLTLDDGRGAHPAGGVARTVTRELRLPCPLAGAAPVFSRCRALLERSAPPAPVCGVRVEVTATAPG